MNVVMFTNTYLPHVGGVARSVSRLAETLRAKGNRVLVVAPRFEGQDENEVDVVRVPAVQHFNGSDFSMALPSPLLEMRMPADFAPDIVHAHHPYLLGDRAVRHASRHGVPMVFTHHTMYEQYTHYVPGDSDALKRFVVELSTGFGNLAGRVIAPSESVREILRERGVTTPIDVVPTGLRPEDFRNGDRAKCRGDLGIPGDAQVVGHMGRLAPEKNLDFLAESVAAVLAKRPGAWFLVVGSGPSRDAMETILSKAQVGDRAVFAGQRDGRGLADCLAAMDAFAFASKSETQGMVLAEAMAAGLPLVALDAPGAREVLAMGETGTLVHAEADFADALAKVLDRLVETPDAYREALDAAVDELTCERSAERHFDVYARARMERVMDGTFPESDWERLVHQVGREWDLWNSRFNAVSAGVAQPEVPPPA